MSFIPAEIPEEPVLSITIGLLIIFIAVLLLPFRIRKVEENIEAFFFLMGIIAVSISNLWSLELIKEAIRAPIMIGGLPIGIFQVVLFVGLFIHFYNREIYSGILRFLKRMGATSFVFILILVLGLISSLISVIVTAVILSEVVSTLPTEKRKKIELTVFACFAVGMGAALTPLGEPLSTIAVSKLSGEPYYADFFFLFRHLGIYIILGVVTIAAYSAYRIGRKVNVDEAELPIYDETLRTVILRAIRVYLFISALVLLGGGFTPLVKWYFTKIPHLALYWINMVSAVLDNATLTAAEIGPYLSIAQIKSALLGLIVSGGMLIPGNIPNIVSAGRLRISSREWARIGVPFGLIWMFIYFIMLLLFG